MQWLAGMDVRSALVVAAVLLAARAGVSRSPRLSPLLSQMLVRCIEVILVSVVVVFLLLHRFLFQLFFIPSGSMLPTLELQDRILVNKWAYRTQPPQRGEVVVFDAPPGISEEPCAYIKRVVGLPGETVSVTPDTLYLDGRPLAPILLASEAQRTGDGLLVPDDARVRVEGNRVLVNGEMVLMASAGSAVRQLDQALLVDGRLERRLTPGESVRFRPLRLEADGLRAEGTVVSSTQRQRLTVVKGRDLSLQTGAVYVDGRRLPEGYTRETPRYAMEPVRLGRGQYLVLGDNRNNSKDSHYWGALDGRQIVGRAEAIYWPLDRARSLRPERSVAYAGLW